MKDSCALLGLSLCLLIAVDPAFAGRARLQPQAVREPVESARQTVLTSRAGRAQVASSDEETRLRLRRGERLVEIAELAQGWAAAGLRTRAASVDLVVLRDIGSGVDRLPSPARGEGVYRARPRLLSAGDDLAGVAWLEGRRPDRMAVRAAQWTGGAWNAAETVAAPGPGSQTGLAQAVLADGSWLLVWSRFDGRENELYWSRWAGGAWTPPVPVEAADGVPDVTPTLVASGRGALLAWSEYDGRDYRLRAARLGADGWSRLPIDAGRGVLQPTIRRRAEGTWVLARSARPHGWLALEVTPAGTARRLSRIATDDSERPLLRFAGVAGMVFEWADGRRLTGRWEAPR